MGAWQEKLLQPLQPGLARLTLAADPDGVLQEAGLLTAIRERGFEILVYEDPVHFRYRFETLYRPSWERGETGEVVVVLPFSDWERVPYDLWKQGRRLSFDLGKFFPHFSYRMIQTLSPEEYEPLDALHREILHPLSDRETGDLILRRLFKWPYDLVESPEELVDLLLSKHLSGRDCPEVLDRFLMDHFYKRPGLASLPLANLITSKEEFFRYLQQEWPRFLQSLRGERAQESGREPVSFDHPELRHRVDNLFLEGYLQPVEGFSPASFAPWIRVGIQQKKISPTDRFDRLQQRVKESWAAVEGHREWLQRMPRMADLDHWVIQHATDLDLSRVNAWEEQKNEMESAFEAWFPQVFGSLVNLPYLPHPVMLHQVPRYLARTGREKIALVVVDGMSWVNWVQVRQSLAAQRTSWTFSEQALFAWVPTLTNISRQALFSGEAPFFFPDSWRTTQKEPEGWRRFWENQGVHRGRVGYQKGLGEEETTSLSEWVEDPGIHIWGLVVSSIDEMAHGVTQGAAGLHSQIQVWLSRGYLLTLIDRLLYNGFDVYLTSDHGNVECTGTGRIQEGLLAETRGHRARIYEEAIFREEVHRSHRETLLWPGAGLPPGVLPLLARGRTAFTPEKGRIIAHGGIHPEEVIVPLVKVVDQSGAKKDRI